MSQIIVSLVPDKRQKSLPLASFIDDVVFRIPLDIHTKVFSKIPPYKHLNSNCGAACGNRRRSGRQTARCRPKRQFGNARVNTVRRARPELQAAAHQHR